MNLDALAQEIVDSAEREERRAPEGVEIVDHDDLDRAGSRLLHQDVERGPIDPKAAQTGVVEDHAMTSPQGKTVGLATLQLESGARMVLDRWSVIDGDMLGNLWFGWHMYNIQMKIAAFKRRCLWLWQDMPPKVNDRMPGRALQALRIAAGFESAAAAAARNNWPASRYASHESGTRPILPEDAKRYAAVYGVEEKQLLSPTPSWLKTLQDRSGYDLWRRMKDRADRLAAARILAGYSSYAEVARAWDLKPSTYLKHEQGKNSLANHFIELYAQIFGVRAEWLRSGELPSGLGPEIDGNIAEVLKRPDAFAKLRPAFSKPDKDRVTLLKKATAPGRPGVSSLGIPEYDWSEIERVGGTTKGLAHRSWSVPSSFFTDLGLDQRSTFVVVANLARDRVAVGERLIVSTDDLGQTPRSSLVYRRGKLTISDAAGEASKVGSILWRLVPVNRQKR